MTVIAAAFRNEDDYAIAADSQAEMNGARLLTAVKVYRWGRVLFGGWGTSAQLQRARRYLLEREPPRSRQDLEDTLVDLHNELRGYVGTPAAHEVAGVGVGFLFVDPWGIVEVDSAGNASNAGAMWAQGSGGAEARGAMWAVRLSDPVLMSSAQRVTLGVRAAIALDVGCGGDVQVLTSCR